MVTGPLAPVVENLGTAIASFPIVGAAALDGGLLAIVSRNLRPARVALLDLAARRVEDVIEIPTGEGAWAVATDPRGALWLGMFGARGRANLCRLDLADRSVEVAAAIDAVHLWDLAVADDGMVYGVSDGPAGAFAFDPSTWRARDLGVVETGPEFARSVETVGRYVVLGGRRDQRALLRVVDPAQGSARSILPAALASHGIVYALHRRGKALAVGTRGPAERDPAIAVLDVSNIASGTPPAVIAIAAGESVAETLLVEDDATWATVRPSGGLLRVRRGSSQVERVAEPVPLVEQRRVARIGADLVGASGDGSVWRLAGSSGPAEVIDLVGEGLLEGDAETVQSLAARDGRVWAGGTFGVARRDWRAGGDLERVPVPGEPKAMTVVGRDLYLALYPIGEVWTWRDGQRPSRLTRLPAEENRPLALVHDAKRNLLLVGTAADRAGGGGLHLIDPATGDRTGVRNPIDSAQRVQRIAVWGDLALLGGTADGTIVAWDLKRRAEAWRLNAAAPGGGGVTGLAVTGERAHVLTSAGTHLIIDLARRRVGHRFKIADSGGALVAAAGEVWGVDADRLLRIDPVSGAVSPRLRGLAPRHWAHPSLVHDGGDLFLISGTDVLRVPIADA